MQNDDIYQKIKFLQQHFNFYLNKRINNRIEQKLKKHYSNCRYSERFNRFHICTNVNNLKKDSYVICSDERCNNCPYYKPVYTSKNKQQIIEQFYNDINDPAICGNKQPKIAVLIWVLKLFRDEKTEKKSIWKKIFHWIKNGFVCR